MMMVNSIYTPKFADLRNYDEIMQIVIYAFSAPVS